MASSHLLQLTQLLAFCPRQPRASWPGTPTDLSPQALSQQLGEEPRHPHASSEATPTKEPAHVTAHLAGSHALLLKVDKPAAHDMGPHARWTAQLPPRLRGDVWGVEGTGSGAR